MVMMKLTMMTMNQLEASNAVVAPSREQADCENKIQTNYKNRKEK
jgi:hypothetical protein